MNQATTNKVRVLAIAPSARGFGYAVMEDQQLAESGYKGATGDKNSHSLSKIERLMKLIRPDVFVLPDVNAEGCRRAPRIKALHQQLMGLATKSGYRVTVISTKRLRTAMLGNPEGTKQEMAEFLAGKFPDLLADKLPPKRRAWESEDGRMDMFDAVGLAVVFWMIKNRKRYKDTTELL